MGTHVKIDFSRFFVSRWGCSQHVAALLNWDSSVVKL